MIEVMKTQGKIGNVRVSNGTNTFQKLFLPKSVLPDVS